LADDDIGQTGTETPVTPTSESTAPSSQPKEQPRNTDTLDDDPDTGTPDAEKAGKDENGNEQPKKSRAQRRIEQLATQNRDLQRQIAHFEKQAKTAKPTKALDPLDFPSDAAYNAALIKQTVQETQTGYAETQAKEAAQQADYIAQQIWDARVEDYAASVSDFEAVAFSDKVPYSPVMLHLARGLDNGPAVAYHLGKNPVEAQRIAGLSPVETAIEMGRLSERVSKGVVARKIPGAPNPPQTVRGGSAPASKAPSEMSMSEYEAAYKKRMAAKSR